MARAIRVPSRGPSRTVRATRNRPQWRPYKLALTATRTICLHARASFHKSGIFLVESPGPADALGTCTRHQVAQSRLSVGMAWVAPLRKCLQVSSWAGNLLVPAHTGPQEQDSSDEHDQHCQCSQPWHTVHRAVGGHPHSAGHHREADDQRNEDHGEQGAGSVPDVASMVCCAKAPAPSAVAAAEVKRSAQIQPADPQSPDLFVLAVNSDAFIPVEDIEPYRTASSEAPRCADASLTYLRTLRLRL